MNVLIAPHLLSLSRFVYLVYPGIPWSDVWTGTGRKIMTLNIGIMNEPQALPLCFHRTCLRNANSLSETDYDITAKST